MHMWITFWMQKYGRSQRRAQKFRRICAGRASGSELAVDVRGDVADVVLNAGGAVLKQLFDLIERVNDGRVVTAELAADVRKAQIRHFADEIHGDLTRLGGTNSH